MQIKGITFTERELDIIACVMHLNGSKKIAQILGISPRTIEGHIQNVLHKIGVNSRENIKEKIEESSEVHFIKRRYIQIQIKSLFFEKLKQIKSQNEKQNISCILDSAKYKHLSEISSMLKEAGVRVLHQGVNGKNPENNFELVELNDKNIKFIKNVRSVKSKKVLICFDKKISNKYSVIYEANIIDNTIQDKKYESVFRILKILNPSLSSDGEISKFTQLRENLAKLKFEPIIENDKLTNCNKNFPWRKKMMMLLLLIMTAFVILFAAFYVSKNGVFPANNVQGVNFVLPNKNILLKREDINNKLDHIFKNKKEINIAILQGLGGAGKTTTARDYARSRNASVIWEVNAETKDSLLFGFENLAYLLCSDEVDKKELRHITGIKSKEKKEGKLLLFVQQKLKANQNWCLIFDNIEQINEISQYIPNDKEIWGIGRVIITTRNSNIASSNIILQKNIVDIGEITEQEKLKLFVNITKDLPYKTLHSEEDVKEFLVNIPSFPLDVSIAAHYLKDTGMQFGKYLKELESSKEEFTKLQESILKDASQYDKTRYNIVSLTLKKMMKSNSEFYDLYLLLGMVDSQDIPQELLFLYKSKYITNNFLRELHQNSLITNIQYKNDKSNEMDNMSLFSIHRSTQANILANAVNSLTDAKRKQETTKILEILQTYILREIDVENSIGLKNIVRHCKSLEDKENIIGSDQLLSIKNSLGIIYYYLGNDVIAKEILESNLDDNKQNGETALVLTHLGAIYRKLGQDYNQAARYLERAISIYDKISPHSPRKALALTHLGNTYRTLGDFAKAASALKNSVKIYHNTQGYYSGEARALGYLGVVYREQSNLEDAKTLLEKAVDIYKKQEYPKYSAVYAGTLAHLGITYRMLGEYDKAKEVLEDSLVIYEQIRPKDHPDIGRNIQNLGVIYGEIGNYTKAEELLVKSVADYEKNYGVSHIETGKVLNHIGRFYTLSKNYNKSEESLSRAKEILESKNHPESYRSYELLGDLYKKMNKSKEEIIENYNRSLELALKYFDKQSINVGRVKSKIKSNYIN